MYRRIRSERRAPGVRHRALIALTIAKLRAQMLKPGAGTPTTLGMDSTGTWLCPTEADRARALEAGDRVRVARTIAAGGDRRRAGRQRALGRLVDAAAAGALRAGAAEPRPAHGQERRSPSGWPRARSCRSCCCSASASRSTRASTASALPWLVIPVAMSATRFRWQGRGRRRGHHRAGDGRSPPCPFDPQGFARRPDAAGAARRAADRRHGDHARARAAARSRAAAGDPRPAHGPAQPRGARDTRRGAGAAGAADRRRASSLVLCDIDHFKRHQRHPRPRSRRRGPARRRLRDAQVAAQLRARVPHRRRGVPDRCCPAWTSTRRPRSPSASAATVRDARPGRASS